MTEVKQFRLPDVGEGLTEADIVTWHVKAGDRVTVNQVIVDIETAKAVVELPCPYEGVVTGLLVDEGQTVDVGTPIIAVDVTGTADGADAGSVDAGSVDAGSVDAGSVDAGSVDAGSVDAGSGGVPVDPAAIAAAGPHPSPEDLIPPLPADSSAEPGPESPPAPGEQRQAVLVGYGVKLSATTRRPRKGPAAGFRWEESISGSRPAAEPAHGSPAGSPAALDRKSTRKLARDLGVDLAGLPGSGPGGSITRDDVQAAVGGPTVAPAYKAAAALPREERIAVRGGRKRTAAGPTSSLVNA